MIFRPAGFDEMLEELDEARSDGDLADESRNAILAKWGVRLLEQEP